MRPILFAWRGYVVRSYPTFLYLGMVLGVEAQLGAARARGLDGGRVLATALVLLFIGLVGARALYAAIHRPFYRGREREVLSRSRGGASAFGGLLAIVLAAPGVIAVAGLPFAAYCDGAGIGLIVGMLVGRFGCLLHGCCAGRPTSGWLGMILTDCHGVSARRVPTQLLDCAWSAVVLAGAVVVFEARPFDGAAALWAIGGYAAGRVVLETTRESQDRIGRVRVHRAIATAIIAGCSIAWLLAA